MYDSFEPLLKYEIYDFEFNPKILEVWEHSLFIKKKSCNVKITVKNSTVGNTKKIIVKFNDNLNSLISEILFFEYEAVGSIDRLVLLNLPINSKNIKVKMLSELYKIKSNPYTFKDGDAYACSLFYVNGNITKMSFNIISEDRLVEFY